MNIDAERLYQQRIEHLEQEVAEMDDLCKRLTGLLDGVTLGLKGPPPPRTRYSWHDLPEWADKAAAVAKATVAAASAAVADHQARENLLLSMVAWRGLVAAQITRNAEPAGMGKDIAPPADGDDRREQGTRASINKKIDGKN